MTKPKGDMHILGPTHEPLTICCEQCNERLALGLGDADHSDATIICFPCIERLAKWVAR